jgi:hypothetical protein
MVLKKGKNYDFQVKQKDGKYRLFLLWNPQTCCHVSFTTNVPIEELVRASLLTFTHKAARLSASFFPGFLETLRETGAQAFTKLFQYIRQVMTFSSPQKTNTFTPFGEGKVLS